MKKKFLLLVSLVLLGVQGWSIPLDSLKTHVSTLDSLQRNRFERLDTLKPFDGFIHPGFNPSSIVFDDVNGNTSNKFSFTCLSNLPDTITFTTNVGESESYSFDLTDIAGGGPAPEHQGGSTLLDVLFVVNLNDKTGMYTHEKQMLEDDGPFSSGDYWLWQPTTRHSVIYLPTTSGSHDAKVVVRALLMGVIPIQKKTIYLKGSTINTSTDLERHINTSGPSFPDVIVGDSVTVPLHVSGTNLNGPLSVKLDDKTGMFHIDRDNITADEATNGGVDVMVTYKPTFPGTHGASIDITGDVSENVSVVFTGHSNYPSPPLITVDPTSLDFGDVVKGETRTRPITITGTYLTDSLTLFLDQDYPYVFSIDKKSISIEEAKKGAIVNVTYSPTMLGNNDWGNIEIYIGNALNEIYWSGGQEPIDVPLSGYADWPPTPTIGVEPSTWDFGIVNVGEESIPKTFTVTGTNLHDRITIISQLETPGVEFTVLPESESLPANGGIVTITYKPLYEGSASQDFILSSSGVSTRITVSGTGVIPPTIKPDVTSLDFGTVVKGKTAPKKFTVRGINLTGDLALSVSKPWFTVSPATITAADAAGGKEVTVIYNPTAGGNHNATLTISGGDAPDKKISLTGKCSAIDIAPSSSHNFGTVKEGSTNTATFTVTGTNLSERISLIWPQEDGFTINPTDLPTTGGKVTVSFKPTSGGSYSQEITLNSGQASEKISVSGKCATITTSRSSLDFGTIAKGKEKPISFWVKGTCLTGDLTLSSSSSMFKVVPDKITASEAVAGKTVTVTYKPTVKGTHTATITISGGNAVSKLVQLTGKCVVPVITTSTNSINYMGKESKQFKVTGTDLTGNLTLTIIGSGKNYFNLSKTSITASAAASGVNVSVLCNAPSTLSSASAQVKISGGDAVTKYVDLYYNQNQPQAINSVQPGTQDENGNDNSNNEFTNGVMLEMTGPLTTDVNELLMNARVYAEGLNIIIETPMEQKALISDIAGHVREVNLKAGRNEIPVNANGVFIVRIREKTTKLMLK